MEVLRRSCAVADLDVVFRAKLEEAFDASAGMLGALPFEAVRQQQNEAARLIPLRFGRNDELVDNDLPAIYEIAKLGLPHYKRERIGNAIAEFEAHGGEFAQQAVHYLEFGLFGIKVL